MADDKGNPGRPDRDRNNMEEGYEVQYWGEGFGVSQEELATSLKKSRPGGERCAEGTKNTFTLLNQGE